MALPTILVNSATGSDTQASGAGPSTALFGTTDASTDGAGTTVTLTASTDLTNVATDGSHVIFLNDATAGARNFGKITGKAGSGGPTPTVTVADAFGINLTTKSWAIGGKRASIGGTNSVKLIENNAASGDAMPGWIMEMESGHTETIAATVNPRRAGDATNGSITLRGTSGAGTMPIIIFSNNGDAFVPRAVAWLFQDFEMRNSNATKTSSQAFNPISDRVWLRNIRITHATDKFWKALKSSSSSYMRVQDCSFKNCANVAIDIGASTIAAEFVNNVIASNGSHGLSFSANATVDGIRIIGNIFAYNTTDGINTGGNTSAAIVANLTVRGNVFHGNGSDGIDIPNTSAQQGMFDRMTIEDNEFTYNGARGIAMGGSGITDALLKFYRVVWRNNAFFGNVTEKYTSGITISENEVITDPSGGLADATHDYAGGASGTNFMSSVHKDKGYPLGGTLAVGGDSSSYNYQGIGIQAQPSAGNNVPIIWKLGP